MSTRIHSVLEIPSPNGILETFGEPSKNIYAWPQLDYIAKAVALTRVNFFVLTLVNF